MVMRKKSASQEKAGATSVRKKGSVTTQKSENAYSQHSYCLPNDHNPRCAESHAHAFYWPTLTLAPSWARDSTTSYLCNKNKAAMSVHHFNNFVHLDHGYFLHLLLCLLCLRIVNAHAQTKT
jgi:hypothetical protein